MVGLWKLTAAFYFIASSACAVPENAVHLLLTSRELRHIFAVNISRQVPSYQLVNVFVSAASFHRGRCKRRVMLSAFGFFYKFHLIRNGATASRTDLLEAHKEYSTENISIRVLNDTTDDQFGNLYQDISLNAVFLVYDKHQHTVYLDGMIGDVVLMHLPERLMAFTDRLKICNETFPKCNIHIVYKRLSKKTSLSRDITNDNAIAKNIDIFADARKTKTGRRKREISDLYPEVMVIVDVGLYAIHGYNAQNVKKYILSFMNAVDLRYRNLTSPRIRLSVAGITIIKSVDSAPYLHNHMTTDRKINAQSALASAGSYLFTEHQFPSYDLVLILTDQPMCTKSGGRRSRCSQEATGFAYVGGGCSVSRLLGRVNSLALVHDTGGFFGVIVAAHEIGHLLGAVHDGSPATTFAKGPGASSCRWTDGYIMSDLRHNIRGLQWSSCSVQQFEHFSKSALSHCMHNRPHETIEQRVIALPGKLTTLDSQCQYEGGSYACFNDHRVCTQLFCFVLSSGVCVAYHPAAEGSTCGNQMHCIDGLCVPQYI